MLLLGMEDRERQATLVWVLNVPGNMLLSSIPPPVWVGLAAYRPRHQQVMGWLHNIPHSSQYLSGGMADLAQTLHQAGAEATFF